MEEFFDFTLPESIKVGGVTCKLKGASIELPNGKKVYNLLYECSTNNGGKHNAEAVYKKGKDMRYIHFFTYEYEKSVAINRMKRLLLQRAKYIKDGYKEISINKERTNLR